MARRCRPSEPGVRSRSLAPSRSAISAALAFKRSTSVTGHLRWGWASLPSGGTGGQRGGTRLRAEVHELQGHVEVVLLDGSHHGLEIVLGLAAHPDLIALDVALDLDLQALDVLHDLLGLLLGDADVHVDRLLAGALGGGLDGPDVQGLERDLAPDGLLLQDLDRGLQAVLRGGTDL